MLQPSEKFLFKNAIDLNFPPNTESYENKISQFTLGDLHGNPVKLIFTLISLGIYKLDNKYYSKLIRIYDRKFIIPREVIQKMVAKGLPAPIMELQLTQLTDYLFKIYHLSSTYNAVIEDFLPFYYSNKLFKKKYINLFIQILEHMQFQTSDITLRLIGDVLCDRGHNDYLTLKVIEKMCRDGVSFRILASNHDAVFYKNLDVQSNQFEIFNRLNANEFSKIKEYISLRQEDHSVFEKINQCTNHKTLAFTSEECSIIKKFIFTVIKAKDTQLYNSLNNRLMISKFKNYNPLLLTQGLSYDQMVTSILAGDIDENEIISIFYTCYLPHLILMDYSINPDDQKLSIYTHAPITLNHLNEIKNLFQIDLNLDYFSTKETIKQISTEQLTNDLISCINQINTKFRNKHIFMILGELFADDSKILHRFVWRRLKDIFSPNILMHTLNYLENPFNNTEESNKEVLELETQIIFKLFTSYDIYDFFVKNVLDINTFESFLLKIENSDNSWELMCTEYNFIHELKHDKQNELDWEVIEEFLINSDYLSLRKSSDYVLFQKKLKLFSHKPSFMLFSSQFFIEDVYQGYLKFKEFSLTDEGEEFLKQLPINFEELQKLNTILNNYDNYHNLTSNQEDHDFFSNLQSIIDESPLFEILKQAYNSYLEIKKFEPLFSNPLVFNTFLKYIVSISEFFYCKTIHDQVDLIVSRTQQQKKLQQLMKIHTFYVDIDDLKSNKEDYSLYFTLVHQTGVALNSKLYNNQRNTLNPLTEFNNNLINKVRFVFGHDYTNMDNMPTNYINLDNRLGKIMLQNLANESMLGMHSPKEHQIMDLCAINDSFDNLPQDIENFKSILTPDFIETMSPYFNNTMVKPIFIPKPSQVSILSNTSLILFNHNRKRRLEAENDLGPETKKIKLS